MTTTTDDQKLNTYTYATFMETNEEEQESWYTFIRYQGNEANLKHLEEQINTVEWALEPEEGLSALTLELGYLVSENTAKEMTKVDLNSQMFHRKFDGIMKRVDLNFKSLKNESKRKREKINDKNMEKALDVVGYGSIDDYLTDEDVDEEDLVTSDENEDENENEDVESGNTTDSDNSTDSDTVKRKPTKKIPVSLQDKPRAVRKAQSKARARAEKKT
jgi:hypothetical protein